MCWILIFTQKKLTPTIELHTARPKPTPKANRKAFHGSRLATSCSKFMLISQRTILLMNLGIMVRIDSFEQQLSLPSKVRVGVFLVVPVANERNEENVSEML